MILAVEKHLIQRSHIQACINLVRALEQSMQLESAIVHQRNAVLAASVAFGDTSTHVIEQKHKLALLMIKAGQDHQAQPELEELLRIVSSVHGTNNKVSIVTVASFLHCRHFDCQYTMRVVTELAQLSSARGDLPSALRLYSRAFAIAKIVCQPNDIEYGSAIFNQVHI